MDVGFLPDKIDEPIVFYGRLENQHVLRGEFGSSVTFNSQTGDLENLTNIQSVGLWNQITDSFEPLHFGTFGTLPIKILWCLGGLAPGILGITGYVLWWKRKRFSRLVRECRRLILVNQRDVRIPEKCSESRDIGVHFRRFRVLTRY